MKKERGDWDMADLTYHIHHQLAPAGAYTGVRFDFVYVDEVQDLTPAQASSLWDFAIRDF